MRCSDEWDYDNFPIKINECFKEFHKQMFNELFGDKEMKRFEVEKIENETINLCFGDVYTIKDNVDEDSPVTTFRLLKPSADRLCDWLNENIKEVELKPVDKLEKALKELYEPDEVQLNYCDGLFFIVEIKDTDVTSREIAKELDIGMAYIMVEIMGSNRCIYKIWESCLE